MVVAQAQGTQLIREVVDRLNVSVVCQIGLGHCSMLDIGIVSFPIACVRNTKRESSG